MSNILGVFGLSLRTREIDLEEVFREFGTIEKVTIVYDHRVKYTIHVQKKKTIH